MLFPLRVNEASMVPRDRERTDGNFECDFSNGDGAQVNLVGRLDKPFARPLGEFRRIDCDPEERARIQ